MVKIALITGSTRTPRVGPSVASWVLDILKASSASEGLEIEPVAIADYNLPVYDEPVMPANVPSFQQFTKEHSKKWSAKIASFQGYIFVVPEYNGSLAGATKNAIDYLYSEWPGKAAAVISYGVYGGNRANEHLSWSLENVFKLKVAETKVKLAFAPGFGPGTDMFKAVVEGELGEDSKKAWQESKGDVVKQLEEIKALLEEQAKLAEPKE
ncbi:putative NAD(P)H-dependent FMN reductase LOT6 [Apodospora peruviana]|uniref:NAD(P)H-dependent FMN reductase LOT6 n=1 Tax=Apodospora peruviana TaxID=516989 RepID=A0AAE0I6L9_9PEZI|nr:putative NAD(P)H-dependent FMN reductase LOT6 [Apodospora peruviana]